MMEYYCTGGVLQYASGHLAPIELLHVHRVREGERVAKASPSLASHHAHGRGREAPVFACMTDDRWARQVCGQPVIQPKAGVVKSARERIIKLLIDVRVDATHQSTALDIFQ